MPDSTSALHLLGTGDRALFSIVMFAKKRGNLEILVEGNQWRFNHYGVMPVNSEQYPTVENLMRHRLP